MSAGKRPSQKDKGGIGKATAGLELVRIEHSRDPACRNQPAPDPVAGGLSLSRHCLLSILQHIRRLFKPV